MVFSSPIFLFLFLPIVLTAYYLLPQVLRNYLLIASSLVFYVWGEMQYVSVMLTSIVMNYAFGMALSAIQGATGRRWMLTGAVACNLGLLIAFKYANFLVGNLNVALDWFGARPIHLEPVHLPLGISFFTFQALGYVIDVYRGEVPAQRNLARFALYKTFFPQLVAGPIVRYADVAAQLGKRAVSLEEFAGGVSRFVIGLGKKMLIANTLGGVADNLFALPGPELNAGLAWLGTVCYTLQIYFDFSGYTDMAIGLGMLFGISFPENFNYPYAATSIQDFWRRWHMSLSSFFRDYLYIPLGGNRYGTARTCFNLFLVFFLCGLWHGASWTFVIWGLYHGAFLAAERFGLGAFLARFPVFVQRGYTLLAVACGWVFFRADTFERASWQLRAMAGFGTGSGLVHYARLHWTSELAVTLALAVIAATPIFSRRWILWQPCDRLTGWPALAYRGALSVSGFSCVFGLFFVAIMKLMTGGHNPFIYFRF